MEVPAVIALVQYPVIDLAPYATVELEAEAEILIGKFVVDPEYKVGVQMTDKTAVAVIG